MTVAVSCLQDIPASKLFTHPTEFTERTTQSRFGELNQRF